MKFVKIALAAIAVLPLTSYAALGSAPSAVSSPQGKTQSLLHSTNARLASSSVAYTVRESRDADGVTIREYILPSNVVFAVTWQGPIRPDMTVLLGSYFQTAVSASAGRPRGTGPLIVRSGEFQIESMGRPGNFFGKAVLPRLLPASVRVEDLQ